MEHGCENLHRFLDAYEQGARDYRGASSVLVRLRPDQRGGATAERHPLHGRIFRRQREGPRRMQFLAKTGQEKVR